MSTYRPFAKAAAIFASAVFALVTNASADTAATEKVAKALSGYHSTANAEQLENIAGGRANLIDALLELRTNDAIPFVAIRSERLLVKYADDPKVHQALSDDLESPNRKGLARAVMLHLDKAPTAARQSLARQAVNRALKEDDLKPYARAMQESADPAVRAMAREIK